MEGVNEKSSTERLDKQVISLLSGRGSMDVGTLYDELSREDSDLTPLKLAQAVRRLLAEGTIQEDRTTEAYSVTRYLKLWEKNVDIYIAALSSLAATLAVYIIPSSSPIYLVRLVLGSALVVLIPGYVIVETIYPRSRELERISRIALSAGISIAIVPVIGLLLNYTPWGLTVMSVLISVDILTVLMCVLGVIQRYRTFAADV